MTTVSCLGGAVLDLIYEVDRLPGHDGKFECLSYSERGGGMAANAAVAVSRLGGRALWCGFVGDDDKGKRILDGLSEEGVDIRHAKVISGAKSAHSVVLTEPKGSRAIILYRPRNFGGSASWLPLDVLSAADVALADNRWVEGTCAFFSAARSRGKPRVLDADSAADRRTRDAVRLATHTIFSAPGLESAYGEKDPAEGLRLALADCPFVAVTLGAAGLMWLDGSSNAQRMPAFRVPAVETVGAGDLFHGAFAFCLARTADPVEALRFASAAAALKCRASGGRKSYPMRSDVEALLSNSTDPDDPPQE